MLSHTTLRTHSNSSACTHCALRLPALKLQLLSSRGINTILTHTVFLNQVVLRPRELAGQKIVSDCFRGGSGRSYQIHIAHPATSS